VNLNFKFYSFTKECSKGKLLKKDRTVQLIGLGEWFLWHSLCCVVFGIGA